MNYTAEERRAVVTFARADKPTKRMHADVICAHRAMMRRCLRGDVTNDGTLPYGDPHFEFMREVDNPCPCPILKANWRAEILEEERKPNRC